MLEGYGGRWRPVQSVHCRGVGGVGRPNRNAKMMCVCPAKVGFGNKRERLRPASEMPLGGGRLEWFQATIGHRVAPLRLLPVLAALLTEFVGQQICRDIDRVF